MSRFESLFNKGGQTSTTSELPYEVSGGESNYEDINIKISRPQFAGDAMRQMLPINPIIFFIIALIVAIIIIVVTGFGAYLPFSSWFAGKKEGITLLGPNSTGKMPDTLHSPSPYQDMNHNQSYGTAAGLPQYLSSTNPLKYRFKEFGVYENEGIVISEQTNKIFRQLQVPLAASFHPAAGGVNHLTKNDPIDHLNKNVGASPELNAQKTQQLINIEDKLSQDKYLTPEQKRLIGRIDRLVAADQTTSKTSENALLALTQTPHRSPKLLQRIQSRKKTNPVSIRSKNPILK